MTKDWIGVDLDGTLAYWYTWSRPDQIGDPIPAMLERVRGWLLHGKNVRIVTGRVAAPVDDPLRQESAAKATLAIQQWCIKHLGAILPVTCGKDNDMVELWDDRAVQVIQNTGERAMNACLVFGCTVEGPHYHSTDAVQLRKFGVSDGTAATEEFGEQ
jgi:hypothetical protein